MTILGLGRVGGALVARARAAAVPVTAVGRGDPLPAGPALVATRNDDLEAVLAVVPSARWADLVFVQNGMLRPWLAERGLGDATRGLLYFAVGARGAPLIPGGSSPFSGPQAEAVVAWLASIDVPARVVDDVAFRALEGEKLLWNVVYGLLSEALDAPVDAVGPEAAALVAELAPLAGAALGVTLDPVAVARAMADYSASIAGYRGAVKEWPWRNGWFVEEAARRGVATPLHDGWLRRVGRAP